MANETIRIEPARQHVLQVTLNRPEARNALSTVLLRELATALARFDGDPTVRAVVLTGGPKVFAAGADINELAAHTATSILADERPQHWLAIRRFAKPLIAAVNGYALGGGCELAMAADIIIAGETAQFGQPEVNLGVIPGAGGTQRLTHAIGKSLAMKLALSGEFLDAKTALAHGLVAEVTPPEQTIERALALAETIAAKPPLAVRAAKAAVLRSFELPLEAGLIEERRLFTELFSTADRTEGVTAFLEKRKPVFRGE
jgi:enoyl-CoA hydratase